MATEQEQQQAGADRLRSAAWANAERAGTEAKAAVDVAVKLTLELNRLTRPLHPIAARLRFLKAQKEKEATRGTPHQV
jgi:hypothetical protein